MKSINHPHPINQKSHLNQDAAVSKTNNPNKTYLIILVILSFFLIVLGIANIAIFITKKDNSSNNTRVSETDNSTNNSTNDQTPTTAFEDLTKEEAFAFLQKQTDITGILPKDFVGEEISSAVVTNQRTIVSDLDLRYSYNTIEELKEIAYKKYVNQNSQPANNIQEYIDNNFEIKEYDYYAIVTPKKIKGATSCDHGKNKDCDSFLSFKRSYLDYRQEETSPNSFNSNFHLNTKDPNIINRLLRVYAFFSKIGPTRHGNIYSYKFEEQDDKYILTVHNIGAGINPQILDNPSQYAENSEVYAINLYLRRFAADKATGYVYTIPTETGVTEDVKYFPITQTELYSLPGYNN